MGKNTKILLVILLCFGFLTACRQTIKNNSQPATVSNSVVSWHEISPGLSYTNLSLPADGSKEPKDMVLAVIDPKKYDLNIYQNADKESALTIKEIHLKDDSLLTFNGNFFTEDFKPTGLLMDNGTILNEYTKAKLLNGIFAVTTDGKAKLINHGNGLDKKDYEFAIQSGPVLLDEKGDIAVDKNDGDKASRTAIGLNKEGDIVLISLKQDLLNLDNEISLYGLAKILKESPQLKEIGLKSVLNLDGGSSSGLMIDGSYYPEMDHVQNVITVKAKKNA
jgi:uncharacterized protein YigE (DUF2233 family)